MKTVIRSLTDTLRSSFRKSGSVRRRRVAFTTASSAMIDVLEARLLLAADLGDAPDASSATGVENYHTLAANNGPRHTIDQTQTTLFLGAGVDGDTVAQQGIGAQGDDLFAAGGRDDEDGVLNPFDLQATVGTNPAVTIQATNKTNQAATLYGWIDLNRNGLFENATERTQVTVPAGSDDQRFTLTFPLTTAASIGQTYARFRLSTDVASANSTGLASDGEVEDYRFAIRNRVASPLSTVSTVTLGSEISQPASNWPLTFFGFDVAPVGDLDQNGVQDYVVTDPMDGGFVEQSGPKGAAYVVFQNPDGTVKQSVRIGGNHNGGPALNHDDLFGISIASLGDIDGDGITDVAVGAPGDSTGGTERGAVHILRLKSDGTVKSTTKIAHALNGGPFLQNGDGFGSSLTSPGNMDGDGIGDLVVAATDVDLEGEDRGVVYTLFLKADGTVRDLTAIENTSQWNSTIEEEENFGMRITAIGDINNDGVVDLASISASYVQFENYVESEPKQIDILLMNSDGTLKQFVGIGDGLNGGPVLGNDDAIWDVTAVGDVDADGVEDLAVIIGDARDHGATRMQIITLTPEGHAKSVEETSLPDSTILSSLTSLGDTNNDGRTELAWGRPLDGGFFAARGTLQIITLENATLRTVRPSVPVIDRSVTTTRNQRPRFSWSGSDASSYEVWLRNDDTGIVIEASAIVGTNAFVPPANLEAGRYSISVRARNEVGVSAWSARHQLLVAPVAEINPIPTSMNTKPEVSWNRLLENSRYEVWISRAATPATAVIRGTTEPGVTRFTPPTSLAAGSYRVQVREVLASGTVRQWSDPQTFVIETKATMQSVIFQVSNRPLIQWNALAGAKKYDIWIASLDQPSRPAIRVTTATAVTTYRPNALPAGRYQVWVRGIAQDETPGAWSDARVFRSRMVPVLQQNWSHLGIGFHVPYSWALEHEQEAQAYDVWIDDPAQGLTPASFAVRTNFTNGYLETKTIGTYRIWVRAIGPDGAVGAWSAPLVARVDVVPEQLTFNSADVIKPEVRWSSVTGAIRYDVRVTSKVDGSEILTARKSSTGTPVTAYKIVTSLPIGNYEVTVRAIAADGTVGSWSTPMAYNSTLAPELRPYQPSLSADVMLEWRPAENSGPIDVLVMNTKSKKIVYSGQASSDQTGVALALPDGNYRWWAMSTSHQMWSFPGEFEVNRRAVFTNDTSFQTNTVVTLSWDRIAAADRYDVWVTDERGVPVYRNMSAESLQVALQSTLLPGRYRAWVRAVSEDGNIGPWSSRLDFVVQPIT
jgi:methionine-rich copper-binding protein CopC